MRLARVTLAAPADAMAALRAFYTDRLQLPETAEAAAFAVGPDVLAFEPGEGAGGRAWYHFALLVGDLDAARERLDLELLEVPSDDGIVMPFDFWDARAVYFHDPAGNVVELIEHRDRSHPPEDAMLGLSEIGVVVEDPHAEVAAWEARGAPLWSGGLEDDGSGLAFCGAKAHTVIVCKTGRGWLPTGRPAEPHPVDVVLG